MELRVGDAPHEQRYASEEEPDPRSERRRHTLQLVAATAIALVLLLVVLDRGQDQRDLGGFPGVSITPEKRARQLYVGVPQQGATLGSDRAPLRMVEFVDFQCPFCAEYSRNVLPAIVNNYVRTRKVQLEMRPLTSLGRDSGVAARAASGAADQNRLWQFADFFFINQGEENGGYVTTTFLRTLARKARVAPEGVLAGSRSRYTPPLLARAAREARRYGVRGTPTFYLGRRGGPLHKMRIGHLHVGEFTHRFDRALERIR